MHNPMATTMTGQDTLFDALADQHGGVDAMSPVELELVAALVRALLELPSAPAAELPRLARAVAQLSSQLPAPLEGEDGKGDPHAAEASGARERVIKRIEEIAARSEKLAATAESADYQRSLHAAEAKAANLQEQLDALLKLNALLEQRLAMEVTA
jgi:hypothetical protein